MKTAIHLWGKLFGNTCSTSRAVKNVLMCDWLVNIALFLPQVSSNVIAHHHVTRNSFFVPSNLSHWLEQHQSADDLSSLDQFQDEFQQFWQAGYVHVYEVSMFS